VLEPVAQIGFAEFDLPNVPRPLVRDVPFGYFFGNEKSNKEKSVEVQKKAFKKTL
jgi:hypothetical protein